MTKTIENQSVQALLDSAEGSLGEAHAGTVVWYYLALALIHVLGQIADNIARSSK